MTTWVLIPAFLGVVVVIQGLLNHSVSEAYSLPLAVLLNSIVLLVISSAFVFATSKLPGMSIDALKPLFGHSMLQYRSVPFLWWYLLPGLCGFFLVLGIPWSIQNLGPLNTFVFLITSQLAASFIFDLALSRSSFSWIRALGVVLTLSGALVTLLNTKK